MLESTVSSNDINQDQYDLFLTFTKSKTGMVFSSRLHSWVKKQIDEIFKAQERVKDINSFIAKIVGGQSADLAQKIFEKLTVHETMFYRDKKYFKFLNTYALPRIIENNKSSKGANFWVAAGSSGQEIYSILFTIYNNFKDMYNWSLNMHSTDISKAIVDKAKEGIYESHEMGRGMDDSVEKNRFFNQINDKQYQVKDEFRKRISFSTSNLVEPFTSVHSYDFISCRNVLIYFNEETKADIIQRLAKKIKPGGILCLGQVDYINYKIPPAGFEYKMLEGFPFFQRTET